MHVCWYDMEETGEVVAGGKLPDADTVQEHLYKVLVIGDYGVGTIFCIYVFLFTLCISFPQLLSPFLHTDTNVDHQARYNVRNVIATRSPTRFSFLSDLCHQEIYRR